MFNKIFDIHKASNEEAIKKLKPIFEYKNKEKKDILLQKRIKQYNKYYFQKILQKRSCYNNNQWKKDFAKSQFFKKNICLFPTIAETKQKNADIIFNKKYNNYFDDIKFKDFKAFSQPKKNSEIKENEKNEIKKIKKCFTNRNNHRNNKNISYNSANNIKNIINNNNNNITYNSNQTNISYNKDENIISLKFIMYNNKSEEIGNIVYCKKNDLFSHVVDNLMKIQNNLNKNKIKGFTFKNNNINIDENKTVEENKIENNTNIIINM